MMLTAALQGGLRAEVSNPKKYLNQGGFWHKGLQSSAYEKIKHC